MATPKVKKEEETAEETQPKLNKDGLVPNQLIDYETHRKLLLKQRLQEQKGE